METRLWLAKVRLTQGPAKQEIEAILDYENRKKLKLQKLGYAIFSKIIQYMD